MNTNIIVEKRPKEDISQIVANYLTKYGVESAEPIETVFELSKKSTTLFSPKEKVILYFLQTDNLNEKYLVNIICLDGIPLTDDDKRNLVNLLTENKKYN